MQAMKMPARQPMQMPMGGQMPMQAPMGGQQMQMPRQPMQAPQQAPMGGYQNTMQLPQQFQQGMPQAQNMMRQGLNPQMMQQALDNYRR
jgi:hypothetical protein